MNNELDKLIGISTQHDEYDEVFDFSIKEKVLIEVNEDPCTYGWKSHGIESVTVIGGIEGIIGAASYEVSYGGFLDMAIMDMCDEPTAPGWYVVDEITGIYTKGDGWTTDDDFELYYETFRPATSDEIALG